MKKIVLEAIETHTKLLDEFRHNSVETVVAAAEMIISSLKAGQTVYLCGNGGSAADAQHIAGEFIGRFKKDRDPLPAVALTTDTSVITCIGNDCSYEDIFTRQLQALVKAGDILWAFSTSGTSPNVLAAAKLAKEKGALVLAFTGKPNTKLQEISDLCLHVNAPNTAAAQEIHQLAYHSICHLVEQGMFP